MRLASFTCALWLASAVLAQEPADLAIECRLAVPMVGAPIESATILVKAGRIVAVVPTAQAPAAKDKQVFADAIAFPALIDAGSSAGLERSKVENASAFLPKLQIRDLVLGDAPVWQESLRAGIGTSHLGRPGSQAMGGDTAVVLLWAGGAPSHPILRGLISTSLDEGAYVRGRDPTSAAGALDRIRAGLLEHAKSAQGEMRRWLCSVGSPREREMAEELAVSHPGYGVLSLPPSALEGAPKTDQLLGVIFRGVVPSLKAPDRARIQALVERKLRIALSSEGPDRSPAALRLAGVVLASIAGEAAAERALTVDAAHLLGIDKSVGALTAGLRADIVLWSHRPTDPRARVLGMFLNGVRVDPKELAP